MYPEDPVKFKAGKKGKKGKKKGGLGQVVVHIKCNLLPFCSLLMAYLSLAPVSVEILILSDLIHFQALSSTHMEDSSFIGTFNSRTKVMKVGSASDIVLWL